MGFISRWSWIRFRRKSAVHATQRWSLTGSNIHPRPPRPTEPDYAACIYVRREASVRVCWRGGDSRRDAACRRVEHDPIADDRMDNNFSSLLFRSVSILSILMIMTSCLHSSFIHFLRVNPARISVPSHDPSLVSTLRGQVGSNPVSLLSTCIQTIHAIQTTPFQRSYSILRRLLQHAGE